MLIGFELYWQVFLFSFLALHVYHRVSFQFLAKGIKKGID